MSFSSELYQPWAAVLAVGKAGADNQASAGEACWATEGCAACCCGGVDGVGDEGVAGTGSAPATPVAAALRSSSRIARMRRAVG